MGNGDEGVSFGFAPQGVLNQQRIKPSVRPQPDEATTAVPRSAVNTSLLQTHWAWLIIGVLLGAGGTMIGSSLWLQGNYVNPSVAMDAGPTDANPSGDVTELDPERTKSLISSEADDEPSSVDEEMVVAVEQRQLSENALQPLQEDVPLPDQEEPETLLIASSEADTIVDTVVEPVALATTEEANGTQASPDNRTAPETTTPPFTEQVEQDDVTVAAVDILAAMEDAGSLPPAREIDEEAVDAKPSIAGNDPLPLDQTVAVLDTERTTLDPEQSEGLSGLDLETVGLEDKPADDIAPLQASERIYRVQLAAVNDEGAAETYWQEVSTSLPELFVDIEPIFDRRQVDERIFFRIWIGEFEKRVDADDYCDWLKSKGQDCFVTRG